MIDLSAEEQRVLGCLIEKQRTVPDTYPLTLNSTVTACNQSSNRWPIVTYDERTVSDALVSLREKGLTRVVHPSHGARTPKHRHVLDEVLRLDDESIAILTVLLLRGPQTSGELRGRTERLYEFDSLGAVEARLEQLASRDDPLVRLLARQPGQKDARWVHLLGEVTVPEPAEQGFAPAGGRSDRISELEAIVADLQRQVAHLYTVLGEEPRVGTTTSPGGVMFEWSDEQLMMREAVRQFINAEIVPRREELEHGDLPPYDLLRKLFGTFGMDAMAREQFKRRIEREKRIAAGEEPEQAAPAEEGELLRPRDANTVAMTMIPIIELCRWCPGMVTAMGVSMGLTSAAIMSRGTIAQKERWGADLLTLEKIGAWAITEPGSGSDAFGSMKSTARRDGDEYVLNGSKTFITNGPHADTTVFICKLDEGNPPGERKILSFILDKGMPGFEQSKPLRKMGMHSSPTGELFLTDVRVGRDRLIGETEDVPAGGREGAKDTFSIERSGVAAMALGMIEQCLDLCIEYAKNRVQFGQPIGEFQLIQDKLARMEVARLNVQNLVFRYIEMSAAGKGMSLAEASAMKLYSARAAVEVTMEAVQLHGGNGYMAEFQVEQLARDSKVLQIYAGTDEIQITHIAKALLRR